MNRNKETLGSDKIFVRIDPDLLDLIPGFLRNRRRDVTTLADALNQNNFEVICTVGHKMKGDGGGYGFEEISRIGGELEEAAKRQERPVIVQWVNELAMYLERVEILHD